jgi:WXXGXW repeat (2 copies)
MRYQKFLALIPALMLCAAPTWSQAAVGLSLSVNIAPPVLPVYVQPALPAPGYIWSPGYWAWDGSDYYWVPGTWVEPPVSGVLWTPGYWGWNEGLYVWNAGYWGPTVGFYGGVNYGFGYGGSGFQGGYWHGGAYFYNRSVANFGTVNIVNVYNAPVHVTESTHVSFNGGSGGVQAQPSAAERAAMSEHHIAATAVQMQHQQQAASMPAMHARQNGGRPQILTTARAGDFTHPGPAGAGLHNHAQTQPNTGAGPQGPAMRGPVHPQDAPRPENGEGSQGGQPPHPQVVQKQAPPHPQAKEKPAPHPPEHEEDHHDH